MAVTHKSDPKPQVQTEEVKIPEINKGHDTPIMSKIKFSEPNPLIPKTTVLPREPINNGSGCAFI
jgi:hypothetical protein